jgi:hypothetical protein
MHSDGNVAATMSSDGDIRKSGSTAAAASVEAAA